MAPEDAWNILLREISNVSIFEKEIYFKADGIILFIWEVKNPKA